MSGLSVSNIFGSRGPLRPGEWREYGGGASFAGLARSQPVEYDYFAEIEGTLPRNLRGSLYRNGPGLFDRGGYRKRMLLDGDGMVQAFDFDGDGRVRYRNRYVRTEKFKAEEAAGRYLFGTWSTLAPGGMLANFGTRRMRNQAGVSVVRRGDSLYAFDEGSPPYELDPATLATRAPALRTPGEAVNSFAAHGKVDGENGDWLHFGMVYGKRTQILIHIFDADQRLKTRRLLPLDAMYYLHDWCVTAKHLVFILHPAIVPPSRLALFLAGRFSFTDAIRWQPERGNRVLVVDRACREAPRYYDAPSAWCWHTVNAYESSSGEIVADFVASDDAGGIGTDDAPLYKIMRGEFRGDGQRASVRRYIIPTRGREGLRAEILANDDDYEMPRVAPAKLCHRHRFAYFTRRGSADAFWSQIVRLDLDTGASFAYDFGAGRYCTEPVFAPTPARGGEAGYLLSQVFDSHAGKSFLAVLSAENPAAGPIARILLGHHVPLSFHGDWHAA